MVYNLSAELFAEWAVGLVVIAIRLYARWTAGRAHFYWDDLCLGLATIFWTFHTVFLHLCTSVYGSNIGLNSKTAMEVPDSQVANLREGSIDAFIAWLAYIFMVWSFKGVLMFLYTQLTMGLWQHRVARAVSVLCVCTFLASLFFHLFICYPIPRSWQIKPYAGDNCTLRPLNYIVIEVLSITTDLGIMSVPIPLVLKAQIPTTQKAILCGLFSSGIFVMVAAFLRAYYSVTNINTLSVALGWASREALVSVIIVSAPGVKPLLTNSRWFQSFSSGSRRYASSRGNRTNTLFSSSGTRRGYGGGTSAVNTTCERDPYELSHTPGWMKKMSRRDSSGESQERIFGDDEAKHWSLQQGKDGGIMVTTDMTLSEEGPMERR